MFSRLSCPAARLLPDHGRPHRRLTPCRGAGRRTCQAQASPRASVVLTREQGKNDKMLEALTRHGLHCIELPLIQHQDGPDRATLPALLREGQHDWVAVTSPEAAAVFLEAWEAAGRPQVRVAVVGAGTGEVLLQAGCPVSFTPSQALGKVMGRELPHIPGGTDHVLYPASAKASTDLQDSLAASGFIVQRLNTYSTSSVSQVAPELLSAAAAAPIVTFGSPTAVKAWVGLVGLKVAQEKASVCIGSTSAKACASAGLTRVFHPSDPGIPGWVEQVLLAVHEQEQAHSRA
ncbi:uroporphyrinogen-iii synthase [Haematococcus lacustris]